MSAELLIHVYKEDRDYSHYIQFCNADSWNADNEHQILIQVQDILSIARRYSKKVKLEINIEVDDLEGALFHLKKKAKNDIKINNHSLSVREIEILGLIMQGCTNKEIADKLCISFETVRSHRKNILRKTGAKNTAALINYYHQTFFEK